MTDSWLREPLLHFALLGLLIFAVDSLTARPVDDSKVITVDRALKADLAKKFAQAVRRVPTSEELEQIVDGWIQQEILYREGRALGLDRSDSLIRERVVSLMRALTSNEINIDPPSADQLRDYFAQNLPKYTKPRRYDLEHFLISGTGPEARAAAEALLQALTAGAVIDTVGHRLLTIPKRPATLFATLFGDEFAAQLDTMPIDRWQLARSSRNWHVVRLRAVDPGGVADFAKIRQRVEEDWLLDQKLKEIAKRYREMRAEYTIIRQSPNG